jgi:hypothetical protein
MKRSHVNKIKEIEINMQTNDITWNIVILQKNQKKESMNLDLLWLRNTSFKF